MFDALSDRFDGIFTRLRSRGRLSEKDVDEVAREIRLALLEADVNVKVVKEFIARVKERANGADVQKSLSPAQQVIKIVHEELVNTLGGVTGKLKMSSKPPTVVMLAGLQGSGKTTAAGKLARMLKSQGSACCSSRPTCNARPRSSSSGCSGASSTSRCGPRPTTVRRIRSRSRTSLDEAARLGKNVVIVDTAGRLQVDTELMDELRQVRDAVNPTDTLLVVDAMTGQEAVNVATAFDEAVGLDGVILTKIDGDARGGAALSVKEVVGKPILFVGTGEKLEDFEAFHPDRMASRILGMGDVLTLIEKAEAAFDEDEAAGRRGEAAQGPVHARGLPRPDAPGAQDGSDRQPDEDDARHAQRAPEGRDRRRRAGPGRGDHLLDDAGRAPRSVAHQRLPAGADRQGERHHHPRGQRHAQAVQAGPADDEVDDPGASGRSAVRVAVATRKARRL